MARRNKQVWRAYRPATGSVPRTWSGAYILAPTPDIASMVDMCATVAYINSRITPSKRRVLNTQAFISIQVPGHWRVKPFVVFRAERQDLISEMRTAPFYSAPSSNYALNILDSTPTSFGKWTDCWTHGVLTSAQALDNAIKHASAFVGESVDPNSAFFKDAVASRLQSFERSEAGRGDGADSSDSTTSSEADNQEWHPPLLAHTTPFEKPTSTALDDLLYAFATHGMNNATGVPLPLMHPPLPKHMYQPLVFVSPGGVRD